MGQHSPRADCTRAGAWWRLTRRTRRAQTGELQRGERRLAFEGVLYAARFISSLRSSPCPAGGQTPPACAMTLPGSARAWLAGAFIGSLLLRAGAADAQAVAASAPPNAASAGAAVQSVAQPTAHALSLAEAVRIAVLKSEAVEIAQAGIMRARGQVQQARAGWFPQLSINGAYTRTVLTQYSAFNRVFGSSSSPSQPNSSALQALCAPHLDSLATPGERQAAFNAAQSCPSGINGVNFSSVGFGALNQYSLGLNFSQTLFSGQVLAQNQAASSPRRSAEIEVHAQTAQVTYNVTQAYYDAALADRLVTIAESTLVEADQTYRQTQVGTHVGSQSDFDLLQSQVTRNNQVPIVIQRRGDRDIAYYRLKQLLKLPLDEAVALTTDVEDSTAAPDGVHLVSLATSVAPNGVVTTTDTIAQPLDTAVARRSTVREQVETVKEEAALRRLAVSERLPTLSLTSFYQRIAYPVGIPSLPDFLTNWNVAVGFTVPVFTGGRINGDILIARANLVEAQARLQQTRELAALDARTAIANLRQANAAWRATVGTVSQAARAYQIAELRYREGISTQTELTNQRLAQEQALANRAQAARNLQVARIHIALIADLPLSNTGQAGASAAQSSSQGSPSSTTSPQQGTPQQGAPPTVPGVPGAPGRPGAPGATTPTPTTMTSSGTSGSDR